MKSLGAGGPKGRGMTLLNCDQDTERCWKASILRLLSLKIFWARKRKCSGSNPRLVPTSAMNLRFRVSHIFSQGTRSATTKGTRSWEGRGEGEEPQADIAIPSQKGLHPPPLPKTVPRQPCPPESAQEKRCFSNSSLKCHHRISVKIGTKGGQKDRNKSLRRSYGHSHADIPATPPAYTHTPGYSPSFPQLRVLPHHLREGIVPQDGGFGVIVLVAMDDDHQGQRQGLKQVRKGSSWYWGTRGLCRGLALRVPRSS